LLSSSLDVGSLVQAVTDAATKLSGAEFGAFFYNTVGADGDEYMLFTLSGAPREAFEHLGHPRATPLFGPTFRGEGVIRCDDVLADQRYGHFEPHHGMPLGHLPVRSYLAVPVISRSGAVIGGLFFGHSTVGVFTDRTERIISGIAAQAAVALDNARLYETAQRAIDERNTLLERERDARTHAERLSALKDEFLATLSHELRTPLSAMVGWVQVLRRGVKNEADLRRGLEVIERNARAQTHLIEDLLDMNRITSGKLRLDVQPAAPIAFVEAALETVRPAAEAREVRIERFLDPDAGPVAGDPARMQQVVWNLLSNAIKFTAQGGKVQVFLRRESSHVEIQVSDSGIGIAPEFLPHVFERFRQADASTARRFGGLGLGLSIVKHLVELHGGTVRVESAGVGHGATFTVTLPVAAVHRERAADSPVPPPTSGSAEGDLGPPDLSSVTVLVVDDDADTRELIERLLRECGARVLVAESGVQAVPLVERERPNVLISDIAMPDVDGYELLRRVRALGEARGGTVPAIALTAFARVEDRTRALRSGFLAHVSKPITAAELAATVAAIARRDR
jgi:signal transduction histidine kinase/CheY-like chemotaxis protein